MDHSSHMEHDHSAMMGNSVMNQDMTNNQTMAEFGASEPFCTGGMGMVMYMDGFQWTLKGGGSCINLYFPSWTLDTQGKVIGAMFGVFILAMVTEGISKLRHRLSVQARLLTTSKAKRRQLSVVMTFLHGFHAFAGYVVMLATMTFSLELLLCVVFGLTLGYVVFGGESYSHVSTNPCCAFLEEEANERSQDGAAQNSPEQCCDETRATETLRFPLEEEEALGESTQSNDNNA